MEKKNSAFKWNNRIFFETMASEFFALSRADRENVLS